MTLRVRPLAWLWILVALLAPRAEGDPQAPYAVEGEQKEVLRLKLRAAFRGLKSLNHVMAGTGQSAGEPEESMRLELWREGRWGHLSVRLSGRPERSLEAQSCTDGQVFAMRPPEAKWTRAAEGLDRLLERQQPHRRTLKELVERWGAPNTALPEPTFGRVVHTFGIRPDAESGKFKFQCSMAQGTKAEADDDTLWLDKDFWDACTVELRPASGAVVLREGGVEATLRVQDGLPLRWEAHDETAGKHIVLRAEASSWSSEARRQQVTAACTPLHGLRRRRSALALGFDVGERWQRVSLVLKLQVEPHQDASALDAWAALLVRTEAELLAQDEWKPDAEARERNTAKAALLAAVREMGPKLGWSEERLARFTARIEARWAEAFPPAASAPSEPASPR
jgi:hypothetical protein